MAGCPVFGDHLTAPLVLRLRVVLALFVLTSFTKVAHGFYRLAALTMDAQRKG